MSKKSSHIIEVLLGLSISGVVAWSYLTRWEPVEAFSLQTYDIFSKFKQTEPKVNDIQIVGIDDESLSNIGRWPWPRAIVAQLLDEVANHGAKVVGLNIGYYDADQNQGVKEINDLHDSYKNLFSKNQKNLKRAGLSGAFEDFLYKLEEAQLNLDGDAILATSIQELGTVVMPMFFTPGEPLGDNLQTLPEYFTTESINLKPVDGTYPHVPMSIAATIPIEPFAASALAIGHENLSTDSDGTVRRIAPLIQYGNSFYPSFGVQIVREFLNLDRDAFEWNLNEGYKLRKARIPIDEDAMNYLLFSGPAGTFKHHSAIDVLTGALQEGAFKNKLVLIGLTATGVGTSFVTPGGQRMTGLEIWATHLENILNQRFITRPPWAFYAEWGAIALAALLVVFVLPFVRAKASIPLAAVAFVGLLGTSGFLFIEKGMWFSPTYGVVLLVAGFAVLVGRRLIFTERKKELVEAEGLETNKMLGLSFQGQGMLDLAFEKFSRCPIDSQMKDLLYNLGLDMERKRMYTKAAAVYEHIGSNDPKYKDIQKKIELLKKAGEGAVFGSVGKKGSDATVVVDGLGQNTTLGRYEVIKELGRGAMGIVYLGKDPKINRQVAIKTLQFDDDVSDEQMKSIKERFFREAESAGNLTHPNIIRIFDAGEDQDVAYIAMELLEGKDLKVRCEKNNLYPIPKVIKSIANIADALDYAHKQGVVHRDIKPANIMELNDGSLRITDFGIARIQASSKTATGAVLGTPAYMSPEQINGKKVDGRSDIFSLGITFFELLTGEKPFHADSIAALLYRIANTAHPDAREYNKDIPESVIPIINKALAKESENRYQTAGEMAEDLNRCFSQLSTLKATPPPVAPTLESPPPVENKVEIKKEEESILPPPPPPIEITEQKEEQGSDFLSELQETFAIKENGSKEPNGSKKSDDTFEIVDSNTDLPNEEPEDKTEVLMPELNTPSPIAKKLKEEEIDWESTIILPPDDTDSSGEKSA